MSELLTKKDGDFIYRSDRRQRGGVPDPKVPYKSWMYDLYQHGRFGNKLRFWGTVQEYKESGFAGVIGLRYKAGAGGSQHTRYYVQPGEVDKAVAELVADGANPQLITVSEMAPHAEYGTLNAEVRRSPNHYDLKYSTVKKPMRDAFEEEVIHANGLRALFVLRQYLSPASFDDLMELFDLHPGDIVVEISCFSIELGDCPGRNTLVWEVRNY